MHIESLFVADEVLADFLGSYPADHWPDQITKALAVGVRGLTTMGAGATVKGVSEEIERLLSAVGSDTERRVAKILTSGETSLSATLDPKIRSSLTAQAVSEIETAHEALLSQLDLDRADSHTSRLVAGAHFSARPGRAVAREAARGARSRIGRISGRPDAGGYRRSLQGHA